MISSQQQENGDAAIASRRSIRAFLGARAPSGTIDTCSQAAFTPYHRIIAEQLQLPESEQVVCGRALGHADLSKIENSLITEREPVSSFARFLD